MYKNNVSEAYNSKNNVKNNKKYNLFLESSSDLCSRLRILFVSFDGPASD